ncbi:ethanolamine utilization protein EutJ [Clostridium omnivorum]|uniref:Ethanolamine utilization protein EutJ n=2 Tax=Clostridium omnivorum TaxID=1604902 RepID=A0ABQ5N994_9CLOT|nr:ethanolamine utilization protein EutJ [Clostridium sp. E14]
MAGCSKASSNSNEIKIGAILSLTGDVATYGQSAKNGLEILQEEVNKSGGVLGKNIKFVFEDDESKPATSATAAQKLINNDKVVGIVGPLTSSQCSSVGPIANQFKVPMVTGTGTNPKVTDSGEYVFRSCFQDPFQGVVTSKFAFESLKAQTAAVLFDNGNDYSSGLAQNFKSNFEKLGGKVVASENYNKGEQDFNAQLTKLKALNPQVLFLPDYYGTVALIAKQARALGITSTFVGGDGWDSADLFKIGGEAVNGAYFSNHYSPEDTSKEVTDFKKSYEDKYKTTPDTMAVLNYDAGKILVEAIKAAGKTDGDSIKEALKKTNVTVVSGKVSFDEKRNAVKSAVIVKVDGDKTKFTLRVNP